MKVEYSTNNVSRIYFNYIIVNLTNMAFTISTMTNILPLSVADLPPSAMFIVYYHRPYLLTMVVPYYI